MSLMTSMVDSGLKQDSLWIDAWSCESLKSRGPPLASASNEMNTVFVGPQERAKRDPDEVAAFVASLRACSKQKDLYRGTQLHDIVFKQGLLESCADALAAMYAKCGMLAKAKTLIDMHKSTDVISWNSLLAGYIRDARGQDAFDCFECMQKRGISPSAVTYACMLKACSISGAIEMGKHLHDRIVSEGLLQSNIVLGNSLVDMYAKCGALTKAQEVLEELPSRNVVTWSTLITGYTQTGEGEQALGCFQCMQREGIPPDAVTYACVLKACGMIGALEKGKDIHDEIVRRGLLQNDTVLGGALVDMYAKCGALATAQCVLEELPNRNVVVWNALIGGYVQYDQFEQAVYCFERLQCERVHPDAVTYAYILKSCGTLGLLEKGKQIHDKMVRRGLLHNNAVLGSAIVDMYAKCGALSKAKEVLEKLPSRDVISWSALIAGYAHHGQGQQALSCFERMEHEGISFDAMSFVCVLNVCSHLGLVEEGHRLFLDMTGKYGVQPDLECYTCMIDLFGRAGCLEKAAELIQGVSSSDCPAFWYALLGACRKWGDVNMGRWAFEQALQVKSDGPAYVLMANIYAASDMQENTESIEPLQMANEAWVNSGHNLWTGSVGNFQASSFWTSRMYSACATL